MSKKNKPVDWEAIEKDYRAGAMGIRELARWYQISDTAIRKRAKAEGWSRPEDAKSSQRKVERIDPTKVIIAGVNPTRPENIIGRGRNLIMRLLDELDAVTSHAGELEDMICSEESDPRRKSAMLQAVALPSRANTVKALATAYKTLAEAQAPAGKKAAAQEAAQTAGRDSDWGDDLGPVALN